jgi:hypothetical protein
MCAPALRRLAARSAAMRVEEMAACDDHRHAAGDVCEARSVSVSRSASRQQELLGIVGQDADAVDALVDHAVEHAPLAVEIDVAAVP